MTLHIGFVGTGWFARKHAQMLAGMEGVKVASVCGSSLDKAERMASDYPDARGYASVDEMLDGRRLDAVYICVPPFAHGGIERVLCEREIPFFVEKPLGTGIETPTDILRAVSERRLLTSVGYHFRYTDGAAHAKKLLQERTLGMAAGYWLGSMPSVAWWRRAEGSGGQFVEQTTHIVDLLRYIAGEVTEVYAVYADRVMQGKKEGVTVPDVGTVTLKLESGAVATIVNTCLLPAMHRAGLQLFTDVGVMEVGLGFFKDMTKERITEYKDTGDPYEAENRAFLHAVRTGDDSGILSAYADAWRTQQITAFANRSAESGMPVRLE